MAPEASQPGEAQANCGHWSRAAVPAGSEGASGRRRASRAPAGWG
jgi:hypothetical protein